MLKSKNLRRTWPNLSLQIKPFSFSLQRVPELIRQAQSTNRNPLTSIIEDSGGEEKEALDRMARVPSVVLGL